MIFKHLATCCVFALSLSLSDQANSSQVGYGNFSNSGTSQSPQAQPFNDRFHSPDRDQWLRVASQNYISKAQAIEIARQSTDGKILSAKLITQEQQAFYKIKVLTEQGRIKTVRVNAKQR